MGNDSHHRKLMQAIAAGDREAFAGLVRLYQRPLFSFLGRMGLSQGLAEEIAQETFLKIWTQAASYQPERAQLSTWVYALARNLALNHLSSATSRHEHPAGEAVDERPDGARGPAESLESLQQQRLLVQAIRQLGADERSVLGLAYVQELDLASIARIEHTTVGAVKTRLHRARQKLRDILESRHD